MKLPFKNSEDDLLVAVPLTDEAEEWIRRYIVPGGWLIYRDVMDAYSESDGKVKGKIQTSTVVFVSDPNHEWEIED